MLAAIIYETGFSIDEFMGAVAAALQSDGLHVRGAIQHNVGPAPCAAMTLVDLATGERFGISQDLGAESRGCRLDPRGLADAAAWLDAAAVSDDLDLLVLNKFGKAEAEGSGLRGEFARAMDAGVPVLTAVRSPHTDAWFSFHGGLAADLPPCRDVVLAWCRAVVRKSRRERRCAPAAP